jgi:LEA14-like dessication related protein
LTPGAPPYKLRRHFNETQPMKANLFIVLCLSLMLGACATHKTARNIDVSLVNVQFENATVLETTARFTVRLQNASPEPFLLEGGEYKIYINGHYIGKGLSNNSVLVPRLSSVTQPVEVYLRNLSMAARLKPIIESKSMDYKIKSTLYVRMNNHAKSLNAANEGRLDLRDFQPEARQQQ